VRERYDKLAPFVALIDHVLMISVFRVRERAIKLLPLKPGGTVVELGCGTGRNFSYLRNAVGRLGRVIGVEFSPKMFAFARQFAEKHALQVELVDQDISRYPVPPSDLVLLSLCYHTLESPTQTLSRIWDTLKPGACLAIIDGKPPDIAEKYFRPFADKVLVSIFMGDADLRPWETLARLGKVEMKNFVLGAFYVCWAVKQ
jgi:demethylmenaquinone methyltransferase/2-methoxy-6-polyprenyl-1,4-benzoquinol methylase